jgi:hypothetical protein
MPSDHSGSENDLTRLEQIVSILQRNGVKFIVIDGQAEYLMGSPRATYDVDICYARGKENLVALATALKELDAKLRGAPDGLRFQPDAKTLELGSNFTFRTAVADLDILAWVEPLGDFDAVLKNARIYRVADLTFPVIGLDDLIRVKRHVNRPKDRESLFNCLQSSGCLRSTTLTTRQDQSAERKSGGRLFRAVCGLNRGGGAFRFSGLYDAAAATRCVDRPAL